LYQLDEAVGPREPDWKSPVQRYFKYGVVPDDAVRTAIHTINSAHQDYCFSTSLVERIKVTDLDDLTWEPAGRREQEFRILARGLRTSRKDLDVYVVPRFVENKGKSITSGFSDPFASHCADPKHSNNVTCGVLFTGVVVRTEFFSGINNTLVHEVGHWLGLLHVFHEDDGKCVSEDVDEVSDTPNMRGIPRDCPVASLSCDAGKPNPVHNHMSYTSCRTEFTPGQRSRMIERGKRRSR
jgi:hypothetical protein